MKTEIHKPKTNLPVEKSLYHSLEANVLLENKKVKPGLMQDLIQIKRDRSFADKARGSLFFFIGLSVSLLLVTIAINWKTYERGGLVDLGKLDAEFDDLIEVPVSQQPPPPPPVQKTPTLIVEVPDEEIIDEIELELDVEMTEDTEIAESTIDFTLESDMEDEKVEEIFSVVEDYPTPVGGMQAFYKYVGESIKYPVTARRLNIEGMVFVRFVVEKDGSITDVNVIKGIGSGCDEEAVRVVENAPSWNPGKQRGRPVRVMMTVPIRFILKQQ